MHRELGPELGVGEVQGEAGAEVGEQHEGGVGWNEGMGDVSKITD